MIWIIEVPIVVLVIIAMLVGSIEVGGILRTIGIIMMIAGALSFVIAIAQRKDGSGSRNGKVTALLLVQGLVVWLIGIWFGEHNLFEFLFGTGWF